MDYFEKKLKDEKNIYFHREVVYSSREGRKMEMFTVSSMDGIMDERETVPKKKGENMKGLFPDSVKNPKSRPYRFNQDKKVIIFTSRVHPGETPGSHILNGALDIITDPKSE